jgi:hypothetical protein
VSQAFLPLLTRARGAIVNVLSVAAVAPLPMSGSMAESWRRGAAKALERENAALLDVAPVG